MPADLWSEMRRARLLITGGSGFVGTAVLEALAQANEQRQLGVSAVVLTRDAARFAATAPELARLPWVSTVEGDIRTFTCPDGGFSHVIHAATDTMPAHDREARLRVFDTIVGGTRRALEAAIRSGVRRFLMVSTGAVYGTQPAAIPHLAEDYAGGPDATVPGRSGAEAKRAAEALCAVHASPGFDIVIARPFSFLGPRLPLDLHYAAGNFIRDGMSGGPIRVLGDGTAIRSYMHASDLAAWLWTILLRGSVLRPYNVGSEHERTVADVANAVARAYGCRVDIARPATAGAAVDRYVPSTARARGELGLRETITFEEALARTIGWYSARGAAHVAR